GEFDLDIQHRKGKNSADVDGLTRELPYIPKLHSDDLHGNIHVGEVPVAVVTRAGVKKRKAGTAEEMPPEKDLANLEGLPAQASSRPRLAGPSQSEVELSG